MMCQMEKIRFFNLSSTPEGELVRPVLTKTLLTLMFKIVTTGYEDDMAMVPPSKIDSGKIHNLSMKCLKSITPLGYNVVSLVDQT